MDVMAVSCSSAAVSVAMPGAQVEQRCGVL
jgi:hypothetical protein